MVRSSNLYSVMESGDHFKNGASLKNQMSRRNLLTLLLITLTVNSYGQSTDFDEGVVINGVKWATRNVATPGNFVAKPEDPGMFYQWSIKKAWPATGTITAWPQNHNVANKQFWENADDPSPNGWGVPTYNEFQKLLDKSKVSNEWTTQNGKKGRKFTDKVTGNSIFLPANGERSDNDNGKLKKEDKLGYYWSWGVRNDHVYNLAFDQYFISFTYGNTSIHNALNVRSVAR